MRKGEKGILILTAAIVIVLMVVQGVRLSMQKGKDPGIPFYTTSSHEFARKASVLYREYSCRDCHSLWGIKNIMNSVPAPSLDGQGEFHDEQWLYKYFSAKNPQAMEPSRLKPKWQMPSYADIPEEDRRMLAKYIASLKVKDWYLEQAKKARYEKLTGKEYKK
jgi:cytochrome c553